MTTLHFESLRYIAVLTVKVPEPMRDSCSLSANQNSHVAKMTVGEHLQVQLDSTCAAFLFVYIHSSTQANDE